MNKLKSGAAALVWKNGELKAQQKRKNSQYLLISLSDKEDMWNIYQMLKQLKGKSFTLVPLMLRFIFPSAARRLSGHQLEQRFESEEIHDWLLNNSVIVQTSFKTSHTSNKDGTHSGLQQIFSRKAICQSYQPILNIQKKTFLQCVFNK